MKTCLARSLVAVAVCAVGVLGTASPPLASHTVFSYGVDRMEVDGNHWGPLDGRPDAVDEFDDPILSRSPFGWFLVYGRAVQENGIVFLRSPGSHLPSPDGRVVDLAVLASFHGAVDGRGGFTATAYWEPVTPKLGHHYHLSLYTLGGVSPFSEVFGLGFQNVSTGHGIEQHMMELDLATGRYDHFMNDLAPVAAEEVTGRVVFRLAFDDATNAITSSFSVDGGSAWHSPFPPGRIFAGRNEAILILSADPEAEGVLPSTTTTSAVTTTLTTTTTSTTLPLDPCATACREAGSAQASLRVEDGPDDRRDALTWKWYPRERTRLADFGDPTTTTGYVLCLIDGAGATISRTALAPGGRCAGGPCWRKVGQRRYRYADPAGSRGGIVRVVLRASGPRRPAVAVSGRGPRLEAPELPLDLPVTVRLRASTGACWGGVLTARGRP